MQKSIQIFSKTDNLRVIENVIDDISGIEKLSNEIYGKILIATVEAVNNAIIHGNKTDQSKKVYIFIETREKELKVRVKDEGEGFDYEKIPDPTAPENIENIHGRGVFLMSRLSDKISFKDKGSTVEMIFKR